MKTAFPSIIFHLSGMSTRGCGFITSWSFWITDRSVMRLDAALGSLSTSRLAGRSVIRRITVKKGAAASDRPSPRHVAGLNRRHRDAELSLEDLAEQLENLLVDRSVVGEQMRTRNATRRPLHIGTTSAGFRDQ